MSWGFQVSRRSPTLNVGRLRNQISIVQVSPVQDSMGTNLSTDVLYANVWASIEATGGSESPMGGGGSFVSKVTHQIVIRYLAGVKAAMQVQFQLQAGEHIYSLIELVNLFLRFGQSKRLYISGGASIADSIMVVETKR
jgi:head-tail adaptor